MDMYRSHIDSIIRDQHHRGPDFNAIEAVLGTRANAFLGHNRLSIIDLSTAGNQPMWDVDRRLCIVYNGEIYNYVELRAELLSMGHRFTSTSDTEVILESFKRWGTDAFNRFNGMFAFAIFDTRDECIYLVRDRFGVKPLYYVLRNNTVHFASTGGAIARSLKLTPNLEYIALGVRYGLYEHAEIAPYAGMKALLPGHWLQISEGDSGSLTTSLRPYYDLDGRMLELVDSLALMSIDKAVDSVVNLLDDAVRLRLRSDVPVAVSLSGGLDSTTVAALAARHPQEKLHGFTFGAPYVSASEGPLAAQLARMANIEVTYVWPNIDEVCQSYQEALRAQAGPFPGGSIIAQYLVFKAARAAGFKVLLGGQGGDEAFMGYRKFQLFHFRRLVARKQHVEALLFALTLLPTFFAERRRWAESWNNRNRYLKKAGLHTVLSLPNSEMAIGHSSCDPLWKRQILDVALASLPTLLRYEDSNSMGNSIESRLPFLDYRLIEFGIALPEALKLRDGQGKWIIRQAVVGKIPEAIRTARYKKGFDVQQNNWIDGGLGTCIRKLLHERSSQICDFLTLGSNLDAVFSNEQLKTGPSRFAEATSLLWLAEATNHAAS
jgi:asparagine synthase (glutamine-hydrolysing)